MGRSGRVGVIALLCALGVSCSGESASTGPSAFADAGDAPYDGGREGRADTATVLPARRSGVAPRTAPPRRVPAVDVPNPRLTPGAVLTTGAARVCTPGYSASVRDVPYSEKLAVYARYGIAYVAYKHEVDHLVSLEVGGSNAITNLWPEPYAGRWGARTKDVLENVLHDLVCSGRLSLRDAQHIEARNWVKAYRLVRRRHTDGDGRLTRPAAPEVVGRARAATTRRPTRRRPRSTARMTASGGHSARRISCTSRPSPRRSRASRAVTSTSRADAPAL